MTLFSVASFISAPASRQVLLKGARSTSALAASPEYVQLATSFFSEMRVPSSLIAGTALGSLFALSGRAKEYPRTQQGVTLTWILYHTFSLLSVILSLNVVVVATTISNGFLLLGSDSIQAKSCHDFLLQACPYEFLFTRWSFFMSLFAFLLSVIARAILEFDLLRPDRWRSRTFLFSSMSAMLLHLWSLLTSYHTDNTRQLNLWEMTATAFRLYLVRSSQTITGITSIAALTLAAGSAILLAGRPLLAIYRSSRNGTE